MGALLQSRVPAIKRVVAYQFSQTQETAEEPFGRKSDGNVLLGLAGGYPCRLSDRRQNSQCSLLLRPPGNRREEKIRSKRKTGGKRVTFLQDNARPHTAKTTMKTLRKLKWNLLTHPPYSPDLAPRDFSLFGRLKSDLQGMRFADNDAVIQTSGVDTPPTTSLF